MRVTKFNIKPKIDPLDFTERLKFKICGYVPLGLTVPEAEKQILNVITEYVNSDPNIDPPISGALEEGVN